LQLPARTEQTANQSAKRESPSHTKKNRPLSGRIPYAKTAAAAAGDELEKNLHIFFSAASGGVGAGAGGVQRG
jgi:hypothetical protein